MKNLRTYTAAVVSILFLACTSDEKEDPEIGRLRKFAALGFVYYSEGTFIQNEEVGDGIWESKSSGTVECDAIGILGIQFNPEGWLIQQYYRLSDGTYSSVTDDEIRCDLFATMQGPVHLQPRGCDSHAEPIEIPSEKFMRQKYSYTIIDDEVLFDTEIPYIHDGKNYIYNIQFTFSNP